MSVVTIASISGLHPFSEITPKDIACQLFPRPQQARMRNAALKELIALTRRWPCTPGDRHPGWRFMAELSRIRPPLPLYDRPVSFAELAAHEIDPRLRSKLVSLGNRTLQPEEFHPVLIAITQWQPGPRHRRKRTKRYNPDPRYSKYMGFL